MTLVLTLPPRNFAINNKSIIVIEPFARKDWDLKLSCFFLYFCITEMQKSRMDTPFQQKMSPIFSSEAFWIPGRWECFFVYIFFCDFWSAKIGKSLSQSVNMAHMFWVSKSVGNKFLDHPSVVG